MKDFFKNFYGDIPLITPTPRKRGYGDFEKSFQAGAFGAMTLRKDEMDPMTRAARGEKAMGQAVAGNLKPKPEWENPIGAIKPGSSQSFEGSKNPSQFGGETQPKASQGVQPGKGQQPNAIDQFSS